MTAKGRASAGLALILGMLGCHHTHVAAIRKEPGGREDLVEGDSDYKEKSVNWYFWGLDQPKDAHPECNGNGVAEVETNVNVGVTVLTLGFWSPGSLRWKCATDRQGCGRPFGARTTPPPQPTSHPDGGSPW